MSTDSLSLAGKVAIVTGSGKLRGIGAAIGFTLAKQGALIVINYVSESSGVQAQQVLAKIEGIAGKGSAVIVQANIGTPEGAKKLVTEGMKGLGVNHVDILVNNAASYQMSSGLNTSKEALETTFSSTLFGSLYMIQESYPFMSKGGRIINIGSVASKLAIPGMPLYVAAKASVDALTFAMADELGRNGKGVTINVVAPGPVMTDMMVSSDDTAERLGQYLLSRTRLEERPATVEDIADIVSIVVSEKGRWLTGQYISASGGITGN